ncbi:hypothetical protein U9M48_039355 [Paspalum notatum var. saurae]|uniref:Uncharacterized protein n=1 Tax=Paspalum notatum var. saurae TaxID=547442 RepID=A0AAQ3UL80_PASNO
MGDMVKAKKPCSRSCAPLGDWSSRKKMVARTGAPDSCARDALEEHAARASIVSSGSWQRAVGARPHVGGRTPAWLPPWCG